MTWNSPISRERVQALIKHADLTTGQRVLDIGCGSGELLGDLATLGIEGWGIDLSPHLIAIAQKKLPSATFVAADASAVSLPTEASLAICFGSTHALAPGDGQHQRVASVLRDCVSNGGHVLIGMGYQRQPLPAEYATFLGSPSGIENTHGQNVLDFEAAGLTCIAAITATDAEWDAFEWAFFRRKGKQAWRDMWLKHGRQTMGFGAYLLRSDRETR